MNRPVPAARLDEPVFRLLGESPPMRVLRERIRRLAASDAPVAIIGESGSGKELAARDLHASSPRRRHAFIAVNCGAIPEALMESEFFGHKRGAFTGAHEERGGFFQAAHRGTLFLDEVAELPPAMQVKLLRAIQEGSVRKLGASHEEAVDVRIVSATHRELAFEVSRGRFRQDLFYRLQVIELRVPPLRERRGDLPLLCEAILRRLCPGAPPGLSAAALQALHGHAFPGNVRELENVLERAMAIDIDGEIGVDDLQFGSVTPAPGSGPDAGLPLADCAWQATSSATSAQPPSSAPDMPGAQPRAGEVPPMISLPQRLALVERGLIAGALRDGQFNRRRAAALLGISLRQLRYRMQRLGIAPDGS